MKFLFIFIIAFSSYAQDISYHERLQNIVQMAKVVPGFSKSIINKNNLGVLGGMYVQTEWQLKTGRDKLPAWRHINYHLTVEPFAFFKSYLVEGKKACEKFKTNDHPISQDKVCKAWVKYFYFADIRRGPRLGLNLKAKANKLLWEAHDLAILFALQKEPYLFSKMDSPIDEKDYLRGWVTFVHVLSKTSVPTSEFFVRILSKASSPQCSPLGARGCELRDLPLAPKLFVKEMIRRGKKSGLSFL